ncbi:MAG: proton-conducting transporter membrane subunit [bacterium]|nr:proton-conducting transporter membrane subunit [bacterium]
MNAFLLFTILPVVAIVVSTLPGVSVRVRHASALAGGLVAAAIGCASALPVLVGSVPAFVAPLIRMDRIAAFMLFLVMCVYAAAVVASFVHLRREHAEGHVTERALRMYYGLLHIFVLSMVLAMLADHIVLLWLALEATTLSTTTLVAFRRTTGSIEAAWKYIVLCSTGITLGLLGVLMMGFAGQSTGALHGSDAFLLSALQAHAAGLSPVAVQWAFVFLFIGIGTKVGFAPMHTWLPDAHSKTPSPISALLSGVLLNVAFVVLLRFKLIADLALGSSQWTERFFLVFGVLSIAVAAFVLLTQRNYKRMLGYSSIEHMGIMAFAVGLGPFGMVPAIMHMAGHAYAKPLLFLGAGEFLHVWKTTNIAGVRAAITRLPTTATLFLLGLLGLLAVPPSALFASELIMVGYGIVRHPILTALVLILLTIAFIAMMRSSIGMILGDASPRPEQPSAERTSIVHGVLALQLVAVFALGCWFLTPSGIAFVTRLAQDLVVLL